MINRGRWGFIFLETTVFVFVDISTGLDVIILIRGFSGRVFVRTARLGLVVNKSLRRQ